MLFSIGLSVVAIILIIGLSARNARASVERQLRSYWASDDGSTLYAIGGRGITGSKVIYQLDSDSEPIETPGFLSVGWGSAILAALAGSDDVSFSGAVDLGDEVKAGGGHVELAAGRLTLVDARGKKLAAFFRTPRAAAIANAALAGGDEGLDDL